MDYIPKDIDIELWSGVGEVADHLISLAKLGRSGERNVGESIILKMSKRELEQYLGRAWYEQRDQGEI